MASNGHRTPPHNVDAERALLGACLLSPDAVEVLVTDTQPEDFYVPWHQTLAHVIRTCWVDGIDRPDYVTVAARYRLEDDRTGLPADLISLQADTPATGTTSTRTYARIVVEHAILRRAIATASRIIAGAYEVPDDVPGFMDQAQTWLQDVEVPVGSGEPSPTLDDLLADPEHNDWVVPGLLDRADRLLLTGPEGKGKSTLCRQIAVCVASGIHPFNGKRVAPNRVLYIDCENPKGTMQRKFRPLRAQAHATYDPSYLRVERRPEGLDLMTRRDSQWLADRVAVNAPDVLILGPLYKLHNEDEKDVRPARKVQHVLDQVRTRYNRGCALILEAHSPHGSPRSPRELRPRGHSVWMGWPEFGYGIRPSPGDDNVFWFEAWRGAREERDWPTALTRGGRWPWTEIDRAGLEERTQTRGDRPPPHTDEDF